MKETPKDNLHKNLHFRWMDSQHTHVKYRFDGDKEYRVIDIATANRYWIVPDRDYGPKEGCHSKGWVEYLKTLNKKTAQLEKDMP